MPPHRFGVWAPKPSRLEVRLGNERLATETVAGWRFADADCAADAEYQFLVDGKSVPDPRSQFQPNGVHGNSKLVDHATFRWTDQSWPGVRLDPSIVIYELHVGTFTPEGTFDSAIARLDHLVALGIKAVEVMPVAEFSGTRGWGYDGVDLFAPHHAYGGPDSFKRFVDECHARGLAVILDVVYNHLGPEGNYLDLYAPYFTDRYDTPWGRAVNLDDRDSDEVRAFICDNALMWLRDYHLDGFRLDAVHELLDLSAVHILEELAARVHEFGRAAGKDVFLIAESDLNDPKLVRARQEHGYGLDAQWLDDFHHSLHAVLTGERAGYYEDFGRLEDLARALRQAYVYDGRYSIYRGRTHGRPAIGLAGANFVAYLQNHDQVGNRATGDRISALVSTGKLKVGSALVLLSPFVPMLFQGEEWGARTPFQYFTDHQDKALAKSVSEGRRREFRAFGWKPEDVPDPQSEATFSRSKLDWSELDREPHRELLQWHRDLIRLRAHPELRDGRMDLVATTFDEEAGWLVVRRGSVNIACNFAGSPQRLPLARPGDLLLASDPAVRLEETTLELPPESVGIFRA